MWTSLIDFSLSLSLSYDCPEWRKCAGSLLPLWSNIWSAGVPVSIYWLCWTLQCPFLFHLSRCQQLPRVLPDLCWMVGVKELLYQAWFTHSTMVNKYMQVMSTWHILIYTPLELCTRFLCHKGVRACVTRCSVIRGASFPVEHANSNGLCFLVLALVIKWWTWPEWLLNIPFCKSHSMPPKWYPCSVCIGKTDFSDLIFLSQQCIQNAKKASTILGCIRQSISNKSGEVILLCSAPARIHLVRCV